MSSLLEKDNGMDHDAPSRSYVVHLLVCLALDRDARNVDAQERSDPAANRIRLRTQTRLFADDGNVEVPNAKASFRYFVDACLEKLCGVRALPLRSVSGKCEPMSPIAAAPNIASMTA